MFLIDHHLEQAAPSQMGQPAFATPQRQQTDNQIPYLGDRPYHPREQQYEDPFHGELQAQG